MNCLKIQSLMNKSHKRFVTKHKLDNYSSKEGTIIQKLQGSQFKLLGL